jgi:heat shock protein HtpX
MWEAIRANKRRSIFLITLMAFVLMGVGYSIGLIWAPEWAHVGIAAAFAVWLVLWMVALTAGKDVVLGSMGAHQIEHDDHPVLFNVVEEMSIAAGLPKMPDVYLIDTDAPNAFAVGTEEKSVVAVTTGLLMKLNRDELQGVVAHEIGHIKNYDTRFMVLAGVMMGAIILIADVFARSMFYGGGRRRSRGSGGGQGQAVLIIIAFIFIILAPILAQLLYFACSRRREYLADASSARFTRYPEGLARALEKISGSGVQMKRVNRAVAPMFIVNPLRGAAATNLLSTHPPTEDRVRILRSMGGGAAYADYEDAYRKAHGGHLLGERTIDESHRLAARGPSVEPEKDDLDRARDAVDILHRAAGMLFLTCACGLKIKLPPGFKGKEVDCPRCGRPVPVPVAAAAVAGAAGLGDELGRELSDEPPESREVSFTHQPGQWQSFRCPCGRAINLSPSFEASQVRCPSCGRSIRVDRA